MDDLYEVIGNNRIEDVSWICSLSESELDLLISLKKLVILRAKAIGHVELAEKFDLKMLRAIGFVVMEHFRQKVKDLPPVPGMDETSAYLDGCNLLKSKLGDNLSIEEMKSCLGMKSEKDYFKRPQDGPKVRTQSRR
ncbi:unnamed protein product [Linum tenue]|uniref:Gamma-tubulin complex component n=1 Tax=Linum tenue TaxID=586396 RepID=A0AAV0NSW9_9ROSI|nr:unnamed protein product [Linum tenue]